MLFNEKESAHVFEVDARQCVGILHRANGPIGVLIVVGGPQYRVGSHRQYVNMSRKFAGAGIPVFRFDARGMGDCHGDKQTFDDLDLDIEKALDNFENLTGLKRFVILGLCDAASAAWIYAWQDTRVTDMVLINPWLKNTAAQGQVMLKHYYPDRLFNRVFWKKLFTGKVYFIEAFKDAVAFSKNALKRGSAEGIDYSSKMKTGAGRFRGKICLILSGNDLTAREFEQVASNDLQWKESLSVNVETHNFSNADHTFSDPIQEKRLQDTVISFLRSIS